METSDKSPVHSGAQRVALMDELYRIYGAPSRGTSTFRLHLRYLRKKYAWLLVVGGAKVLKRTLDILAAVALFLLLWPLFLVVAICIKLTDGGPVPSPGAPVELLPGAVEEHVEPLAGRDAEVEGALRADREVLEDVLAVEDLLAAAALHPEALGHPALRGGPG